MNSKNKSDNVIFYVEVIFLWTMFVHNKEKYLYYTFENVFLYCHWRFNGSTTKLRNQWCSRNLIYTGMSIYHLKTKCMLYTSFLLDNRKSKDYKLWTSFLSLSSMIYDMTCKLKFFAVVISPLPCLSIFLPLLRRFNQWWKNL